MDQTKIFFLLILSSAAEDIKSNLTSVQGGSVTFPDPVLKTGLFSFDAKTIAIVEEGKFKIWNKPYKDRLFWDKETGWFTLRELQRNDSGIFKIESNDRKDIITYHKLTVYEPVSAPEVTKVNVSTDSCTLLCEVQKAEQTTLYWYRDKEIVNQTNWADSLPLTVENFKSSYRCEAKNPAENKTLHVDALTLCGKPNNTKKSSDLDTRSYVVPIVITAAVIVVALFIWMYIKRKTTQETQGSENRDSDVVYTDIHIPENRPRQVRNQPGSPGADEGSTLTTVYDKIQAHRITPAETDACLYSQTTNSPRA